MDRLYWSASSAMPELMGTDRELYLKWKLKASAYLDSHTIDEVTRKSTQQIFSIGIGDG